MRKFINILSILAIVIGGYLTIQALGGKDKPTPQEEPYQEESYIVKRRDIAETITATGSIKPLEELNLSFEKTGKIASILVTEGKKVKAGETLAKLENAELEFELREAQTAIDLARANLARVLAAKNTENESPDRAILLNAKDNLNKVANQAREAEIQAQNRVTSAEIEVSKNEQNLKNIQSQAQINLNNAYNGALNLLNESYFSLDTAIWFHNNLQEKYFYRNYQWDIKVRDQEAEVFTHYYALKWFMENVIAKNPSQIDIEDVLGRAKKALEEMRKGFVLMREAMRDVDYRDNVTEADKNALEAKASKINEAQNNLTALENNLNVTKANNQLSIANAEAQLENAKSVLRNALKQLENIQAQNQVAIAQAEARVKRAEEELKIASVSARPADVSYAETIIRQAEARYQLIKDQFQKNELISPINGRISKILGMKGELAVANSPIIKITAKDGINIIADIAKTDIALIRSGSRAKITFDVFPDFSWEGKIYEVKPEEKIIKGIVYYEAEITFDTCSLQEKNLGCSKEPKAGMSANLKIVSREKKNAIAIPFEYLIEKDGKKFVMVSELGKKIMQQVKTGLENETFVEILEGLKEKDQIMLPEKEQK